ncbi:Phosphotriesterase homology protein [bacterium HR36]|nr:Phosphotriesterase homology protein [bacterium HR36]
MPSLETDSLQGQLSRRTFHRTGVAWLLGHWMPGAWAQDVRPAQILTVRGPIAASEAGVALVHEHVLVDFVGADRVSPKRYDAEEVFRTVLPYLQQVRKLGCRTFFDCTPAYLGRAPALLQRLAQASGLYIITNTGYYGAVKGKYLPPHAHAESAEQLAKRWLREWREGIEETNIRPGFIKIGVDAGPLTPVNRKLVEAAGYTHLASGLTIAAHTGDGLAAWEEIQLLSKLGVHPSALIWVHAQNEKDESWHLRAADAGAWIEFDGVRPETVERHVQLVMRMRERGHLERVLLSHDAGWYEVGRPGGGKFRPYDTIFTALIPALRKAGLTQNEIDQLLTRNPAEAMQIRIRGRQ